MKARHGGCRVPEPGHTTRYLTQHGARECAHHDGRLTEVGVSRRETRQLSFRAGAWRPRADQRCAARSRLRLVEVSAGTVRVRGGAGLEAPAFAQQAAVVGAVSDGVA